MPGSKFFAACPKCGTEVEVHHHIGQFVHVGSCPKCKIEFTTVTSWKYE
ncbi:MAG: hypothetical protein WED05_08320 [Candidatus Atabeyarchaeum deiterrae]